MALTSTRYHFPSKTGEERMMIHNLVVDDSYTGGYHEEDSSGKVASSVTGRRASTFVTEAKDGLTEAEVSVSCSLG